MTTEAAILLYALQVSGGETVLLAVKEVFQLVLILFEESASKELRFEGRHIPAQLNLVQDQAELSAGSNAGRGEVCHLLSYR